MLDGAYVLEGEPGVTLLVDHVGEADYMYRFCALNKCEHGGMHIVAAFNGFRGEADFEGSRLELLERDLLTDGHGSLFHTPNNHTVLTFQVDEAGVTFIADAEGDQRFVPVSG